MRIIVKSAEYVAFVIIAVLLAFFLRTFILQPFQIPTDSMTPTLESGDQILVNKFIYNGKIPILRDTCEPFSQPQRGDIVVFSYPEDRSKYFIDRVIGIAGDRIEIKNKRIYLNALPSKERHGVYRDDLIIPGAVHPRDNLAPVTVPPGSLFVMGDNRDQSYDSRFWGPVNLRDVLGKAVIIYWSRSPEERHVRWGRLGRLLH